MRGVIDFLLYIGGGLVLGAMAALMVISARGAAG